jgi:hypothetical protein
VRVGCTERTGRGVVALRSSPEERQAKAAAREEERARQAEVRAAAQVDQQREAESAAFNASPPGKARAARQAGQRYFQFSMPLEDVDRTWMAKFSHEMDTRVTDTSDAVGVTLTVIEKEGWELIHSGFTFRETAQASRDKLLASGQQIATIGQTIGFYLFRATDGAASPDTAAPSRTRVEPAGGQPESLAADWRWECGRCGARLADRVSAVEHADEAHPDLPIEQARACLREAKSEDTE